MIWLLVILASVISLDKRALSGLLSSPARQTGVFSSAALLSVLWSVKAGILPGLDIHILGLTAVSLILGWRLATLSALLAAMLLYVMGSVAFEQLDTFILLTGLLPVWLSYGIFVLSYNYLPRHFFVYIFVCSFLAAGLVAASHILSTGLYYVFDGAYSLDQVVDNYLYFVFLIWFPEAMLNGMIMTLLITYRPHWVKTFYDKDYLSQ